MSDFTPEQKPYYTPEFKAGLLKKVPTVPGSYIDKGGDPWVLTDDGHWYDKELRTSDPVNNWMLGNMQLRPR